MSLRRVATNYEMEVDVYTVSKDGNTQDIAISHRFDIPVKGVAKFRIDADAELKLASTNNLRVTLSNMGAGTARHVYVALNATSPFTVLGSSESYLGVMKSQEFRSVDFKVAVEGEAKLKSYSIPATIRYIDDNGTEVTYTKSLGAKVVGAPSIGVTVDESDDFSAGKTGKVTLNVINSGFIDAKFLNLEVQPTSDYAVLSAEKVYIGNLDSDDFETEEFELRVSPDVSGETIPIKTRVIFKTEDANEDIVQEVQLNVRLLTKAEYDKKHPSNGATNQITMILVALPALVVAYIVLWLLFKVATSVTEALNQRLFRKG